MSFETISLSQTGEGGPLVEKQKSERFVHVTTGTWSQQSMCFGRKDPLLLSLRFLRKVRNQLFD